MQQEIQEPKFNTVLMHCDYEGVHWLYFLWHVLLWEGDNTTSAGGTTLAIKLKR